MYHSTLLILKKYSMHCRSFHSFERIEKRIQIVREQRELDSKCQEEFFFLETFFLFSIFFHLFHMLIVSAPHACTMCKQPHHHLKTANKLRFCVYLNSWKDLLANEENFIFSPKLLVSFLCILAIYILYASAFPQIYQAIWGWAQQQSCKCLFGI